MNFAFSDEQDELRKSVRRFLEEKSPITEVRKQMESEQGFDTAVWRQSAEQLGLSAIAIPEEYGGLGFSAIELGIVMEELGRSLACLPFFSSVVLGSNLLLISNDEGIKAEHLPRIASGEGRFAVAMYEASTGFDTSEPETRATSNGSDFVLNGEKSYVIDGSTATDLLVLAASESGTSFYHVDATSAGLVRQDVLSLDQTRHLANVFFSDTPARLVGVQGSGAILIEKLLDLVNVALASEMVGGAQRCLEMSVEYAKVRIQFGRPIGSFQAIKHKCADMLVEVESAKSAAYYAAWAASTDAAELAISAPLAKSFCADAYFFAASENIQIHGGIGFTWEHDAHLYFKRAKSSQLMFGDSSHYRALLADRLGI